MTIEFTSAEAPNNNRLTQAEALIVRLPEDSPGRQDWLLNYGKGIEAQALRAYMGVKFDDRTRAAELRAPGVRFKVGPVSTPTPRKFPLKDVNGEDLYDGDTLRFPPNVIASGGDSVLVYSSTHGWGLRRDANTHYFEAPPYRGVLRQDFKKVAGYGMEG